MNKALVVIDAQNDYLSTGKCPLWNISETIKNIQNKIISENQQHNLIVFIQHLSPSGSAFFEEGTHGAELIPSISDLVEAPLSVQKRHGNAFDETSLARVLEQNNIQEIDIVGMMTQNCVLFTAISDNAKNYRVNIISNCCTSINAIVHTVAIRGLSRIKSITVI